MTASLELARCALEAATGLAKIASRSEGAPQDFSQEIGKLYAAAQRGLTAGLGPRSYPAFLALHGIVRTGAAWSTADPLVTEAAGRIAGMSAYFPG